MRLFRFDSQTGKSITQHNSQHAVIARLLDSLPGAHTDCIYLGENGLLGYHQAEQNQLFLVVQGSGWVRDEKSARIDIRAGQAAFWEAGEWHETGTESGLTAIVVEGEGLQPASAMQEW